MPKLPFERSGAAGRLPLTKSDKKKTPRRKPKK